MSKEGIVGDTFKPGDKVKVTIHPLRNGTTGGQFRPRRTLPDGRFVGEKSGLRAGQPMALPTLGRRATLGLLVAGAATPVRAAPRRTAPHRPREVLAFYYRGRSNPKFQRRLQALAGADRQGSARRGSRARLPDPRHVRQPRPGRTGPACALAEGGGLHGHDPGRLEPRDLGGSRRRPPDAGGHARAGPQDHGLPRGAEGRPGGRKGGPRLPVRPRLRAPLAAAGGRAAGGVPLPPRHARAPCRRLARGRRGPSRAPAGPRRC